jgi:DNA-binding CsgD family transcriptional regulator
VALAERIDADDTLASVFSSMGRIACSSGDADGFAILERSLEHARLAGVDEHIARAYVNLAEAAVEMGRHATADRYVADGLAYTADRDLESYEGLLRASAARLELDRGCLARAAESADAILRGPHTLPVVRVAALVVRGRALARLGETGAWDALDEALELCGPADIGLVGVAAARAEAAWLEGSVGAVEEETRDALELGIERGEAWQTAELAYWRWKAAVRDDVALVGASPFTLQLAGEWRAAAARWAASGCPYEAALALSDADDADRLEDALAAFQELGVTPAARYVGRRLRELGIRRVSRGPRKATRENPAFLTARELDVLSLLDDGFTNAAIADRLFVTPKTVDHHVSAILRKLGVHSRRDAVAEARRRGVGAA